MVRSGKMPQRVALRARIVLGAAAGRPNHVLATELGISRPTLLLWRQRCAEAGVAGLLKAAADPGRKKRTWSESGSDRECDAADDASGTRRTGACAR